MVLVLVSTGTMLGLVVIVLAVKELGRSIAVYVDLVACQVIAL